MTTVGLIADTHGLVRPEALAALAGVERIVHAGDIGGAEVLDALAQVAPVDAVRGNVDCGPWASALPRQRVIEIGSVRLLVLHDLGQLELDPADEGFAAVIAGHSHQPLNRHQKGVLWLNPGSAGPRRFRRPVTIMRLEIDGTTLRPVLIELTQSPSAGRRPRR